MPCGLESLQERLSLSRMAVRLTGLCMVVSCLLSGCASRTEWPAAFSHSKVSLDDSSLIRSQNHTNEDFVSVDGSAVAVQADYGRLQSRFVGSSDHKATEINAADRNTAAGHSFLQPRGRLGRPVFLPEPRSRDEKRAEAQFSDASRLNVAADPSLPEVGPSARPLDGTREWKSDAIGTPSWSGMDEAFIRTELPVIVPNESTNGSLEGATEEIAAPVEIAAGITQVGESEPINWTTESLEPEVRPELADENDLDSLPQEEPTMLDRLRRGLTAPRFDDNTDRLKKQLRRWPDPLFGLLRDRDAPIIPTEESPPASSNSVDWQTADATIEQSDVPQADSVRTGSPLDAVIADLEMELNAWSKSASGRPDRPSEWRRRQTELRMLYLIAGRSAESIQIIEGLPEEEQEFWQSLMLAVNEYRNSTDDETRGAQLNQTLHHLRTATRKLQPLSTLEISRLTFAERIDGFGNVSEFPSADFDPGQRVLIYSEVKNFRTELTDEGRYRSEFAAVLEFRREDDDEVLDTIRLPQIQDECSVVRSDYFQSFELTVPALAGKYQIRLRLRDQLSLQTAESQLVFHVR